jgi:hypothetical protein
VGQFVIGKLSALAVFEPFLADLIAADIEVLDLGWNTFKVLFFI